MTVHKIADKKQSDFDKAVAEFVELHTAVDRSIWDLADIAYSVKSVAVYGEDSLRVFYDKLIDAGARKLSRTYLYHMAKTAEVFNQNLTQVKNGGRIDDLDFTYHKIAALKAEMPQQAREWVQTAAANPTWSTSEFQNHIARELSQTETSDQTETGSSKPVTQQITFSPKICEKLDRLQKAKGCETPQQTLIKLINENANGSTRISAEIEGQSEKDFTEIQKHLINAGDQEVIRYSLQECAKLVAKDPYTVINSAADLPKGKIEHLYEWAAGGFAVGVRDRSEIIVSHVAYPWQDFCAYCEIPSRCVK